MEKVELMESATIAMVSSKVNLMAPERPAGVEDGYSNVPTAEVFFCQNLYFHSGISLISHCFEPGKL